MPMDIFFKKLQVSEIERAKAGDRHQQHNRVAPTPLMDCRPLKVESAKNSMTHIAEGIHAFSFFCNMGHRAKIQMANITRMKACRDQGRHEARQTETTMVTFNNRDVGHSDNIGTIVVEDEVA